MAAAGARPDQQTLNQYDLEVISHETPATMRAGEKRVVPIVIQNLGSLTWAAADRVRFSYHWLSPTSEVLVLDGHRTELSKDVGPGEKITLEAVLVAPVDTGEYLLQWDLVQENVCWFAQKDPTPPQPIAIKIEYQEPTHGFTMLDHDTPKVMWAGSVVTVAARLQNDGTIGWVPHAGFKLSYHWRTPDGKEVVFEGTRSKITGKIEPGQQIEVKARLRAPRKLGRLALQWDMVEENVCWFSQRDLTPTPVVTVWILPQPLNAVSLPVFLVFFLAAASIFVLQRGRTPGWIVELLALGDVLWLGVSLLVKQQIVLSEIGRQPAVGSGWLVLSGVTLFVLAVLLIPRAIRPFLSWATGALVSFVFLADVLYLRFFGDVISFGAIGAAGQTSQIRESIVSLLTFGELWLVADVVLAGVLVAASVPLQKRSKSRCRWFVAVALLPVLAPGLIAGWKISTATSGRLVQVFQNVILVSEMGALNYHVYDGYLAARSSFLRPPLSRSKYGEIRQWFTDTRTARQGTGPQFGVAQGKNLLMIQVESMQGFVVGLEINRQQVTPNLNRWRNAALWFPRCTDQTAFGRTSDGELATQASLYPARRGAAAFRYANNDFVGLAEILDDHGYSTMSAVPFRGDFWNRRVVHPAYGFEKLLFRKQFEPGMKIGWGLNDRDFLHQMVPLLLEMNQPFCALLITLSNHHPFSGFPEAEKRLDVGELENTPLGNYLHTMHFFDNALGLFVEELASTGLLENTVIALWGDHNAGLAWNEQLTEVIGRQLSEPAYYLFDRVPLFVFVPGQQLLRGPQDLRCGHLDIAPTLLALLGIDPANQPMMGRNLLGNPGPGPVTRRFGSWLGGGLIFVNKGATLNDGICYDELSLEVVPVTRCKELDKEARRSLSIGDLVLRYDLQESLKEALQGSASGR